MLLAGVGVFRQTLRECVVSRVCGRCACGAEAVELPELLEPPRWRDLCSRCWPTVSASLGFFHDRLALSMAAAAVAGAASVVRESRTALVVREQHGVGGVERPAA